MNSRRRLRELEERVSQLADEVAAYRESVEKAHVAVEARQRELEQAVAQAFGSAVLKLGNDERTER